MLLTGTYRRSLDDKVRFTIPKRLREALTQPEQAAMYLTPGTDGSLSLFTEEAFGLLGRQLAQGSPTGPEVRAFSRLFYAQAERVEIDRQGRVRIPPELARFARLESELVLLGVGDHLEIWHPGTWDTYFAQGQPRYDQLAERAFEHRTAADVPEDRSGLTSGGTKEVQGKPAETQPDQRPAQPR